MRANPNHFIIPLKHSWPNATLSLTNFEHGLYVNGVFHHFLTNQEKAEFNIVAGDEKNALFRLDARTGFNNKINKITVAPFHSLQVHFLCSIPNG